MATLLAHIEAFYNQVASSMGVPVDVAMQRFNRSYVISALNEGWARAAEDCGGITKLTKHNLTAGQEMYSLSASTLSLTPIITVQCVHLIKNSELLLTLEPSEASGLQTPDGVLDSGTPNACCLSIQKHDSATAIYELRLSPPPDWTETNGLWIVCSVRPAWITADTDSPDVLETMARAGRAWACFEATGAQRFLVAYENEKRLFGKSGVNNMPLTKSNAFRQRVVSDPRLYSRGA